jgi:hypothetical protein
MLRDTLIDNRKQIVERICALCGCERYEYVVDMYGEIDEWWEPYNLALSDDLKLCITFNMRPDGCTVTVYKQ